MVCYRLPPNSFQPRAAAGLTPGSLAKSSLKPLRTGGSSSGLTYAPGHGWIFGRATESSLKSFLWEISGMNPNAMLLSNIFTPVSISGQNFLILICNVYSYISWFPSPKQHITCRIPETWASTMASFRKDLLEEVGLHVVYVIHGGVHNLRPRGIVEALVFERSMLLWAQLWTHPWVYSRLGLCWLPATSRR